MVDQPAPVGQPQMMPPTQAASQFAVSMSVHEIMITVGHSRVAMTVVANGIAAQPMVEWLMMLSVNPTAAKQLRDTLTVALDSYEKQFGKLPVDPKAVINQVEMNKPATP
jgi:hypothetical protein